MKKLILEEDEVIEPVADPEVKDDMATSLITSLIKNA